MLSFLAQHPPRTRICHLDQILLDGGRSVVDFKPPGGDRYLVMNQLPPATGAEEGEAQRQRQQRQRQRRLPHNKGANSSLAPPLHRHLWQEETFHVIGGTAKFTIGGSSSGSSKMEARFASAGEVVVIPKRQLHTFCNASEDDDLVVEFVLDPASRRTDEAYFRTSSSSAPCRCTDEVDAVKSPAGFRDKLWTDFSFFVRYDC